MAVTSCKRGPRLAPNSLGIATLVGLCLTFGPAPIFTSVHAQSPAQSGQAVQPGKEVLIQVLEEALREHPAVKARKSERVAAELDLQGAEWNRFPSLAFEAQVDEANNNGRVARITQPLWAGGRITSQIDLAQANVTQTHSVVAFTEQEVLLQTASAYYEVLRLKARLSAAKENTAEHQKLLELINRRVKLEVSPDTDRVLAESRAQQAKSEEIAVKRTLDTVLQSLTQLLGRPLGELQRPPSIAMPSFASVDEAIKAALDFSHQRNQVQAQIEAAAAQVGVAKAQSFPTLVAGYEYSWASGTSTTNQDSGRGYVGFQYQPGAGLSSITSAKAAESRRVAALESLIAIDRQISATVSTASAELEALRSQLDPARRQLQGINEVVESYLRQYQIGRKTWLDVLNVQREKISALAALADVEYAVEIAKVKLLTQTGHINAGTVLNIHD